VSNVLGGYTSLFNFTYAHLLDKTPKENRLTRFTIASLLQSVGLLLGRGCSGLLLKKCGFLISFLVCFSLHSVALINTLIFVREEVAANRPNVDIEYIFSAKLIRDLFSLILFPNKPKKYK